MYSRLGDMLVGVGVITEEQLQAALKEQNEALNNYDKARTEEKEVFDDAKAAVNAIGA